MVTEYFLNFSYLFVGKNGEIFFPTGKNKNIFPSTPTPWLTLLLVLGKSRVKQNSC